MNVFSTLRLILLAAAVALIAQSNRCKPQAGGVSDFFPLAAGNEWIYQDSLWREGQLVSVFFDTLRVTGTNRFEGYPTYLLSDGRELMWRNDTLFQLVFQRSGYRFPTIYFVAGQQMVLFNYAFGGDVVIQRKSERLEVCPKVYGSGKNLCYRISDACGGDLILQQHAGPVYWRVGHCFAEEGSVLTKTLLHFRPGR
ncbi:MAG: hypothetical protein RMK52_09550 [Chitinophagales bacterium]|nr:hypothetical protein [Chitinophagales bacterium]MDW8394470.1 hypothetical protein [Chitinophagales bacterium]